MTKNAAWKKLAERLFPPLFTFTELLAITVTTFKPPRKPLIPVAIPSARRSLLILERLLRGSNLSTAFILNSDSMTATNVMESVWLIKSALRVFPKFGLGSEPRRFSGKVIINAGSRIWGVFLIRS